MLAIPYVFCGILLVVIVVISRKNMKLKTKMMEFSEKNFQLDNNLISIQEEMRELQAEYEFAISSYMSDELEDTTDNNKPEISSNDSNSNNTSSFKYYVRYQRRNNYLSRYEVEFCNKIRQVIPDRYVLFPQINLASIIQKFNTHNQKQTTYRNELFRNIDFGLFDRSTYELELLIELNDPTHNNPARKERDEKVKFICSSAGIKLITFSYKEDLDATSIQEKINSAINCNSAYLLQDVLKNIS